jgi:nitrogen regulatory protein P-II 1
MKMVSAYVREAYTSRLIQELYQAGVKGLTAYVVHGLSGEVPTFLYSKRPFELDHLPQSLKVEIICEDGSVDEVVRLIAQGAKTGRPGDGIIAVQDIGRFVRVRDV